MGRNNGKSYYKVAPSWYLDMETLEFVPQRKVRRTKRTYPQPYWVSDERETMVNMGGMGGMGFGIGMMGGMGMGMGMSAVRYSDVLALRNLVINFEYIDESAIIAFRHDTKEETIRLKYHFSFMSEEDGVVSTTLAPHMTFRVETSKLQYDYVMDMSQSRYSHVCDLSMWKHPVGPIPFDLSYGLTPTKLKVKFNDKELKMEFLALVIGSWAILLTDDLKFDSLIAVSGTNNWTLHVGRVLYTVNKQVRKAMMLY